MHDQNVVRHQTTEPPIVIKTTGLGVEAKEMLDAIARRAYNIFEARGRIKGRDLDNWLQAEAELFDRLEQTLSDLATPRLEEAFLAFELDLLRETGYLAELSTCVECSSVPSEREPAWFSPSRGGYNHCCSGRRCAHSIPSSRADPGCRCSRIRRRRLRSGCARRSSCPRRSAARW